MKFSQAFLTLAAVAVVAGQAPGDYQPGDGPNPRPQGPHMGPGPQGGLGGHPGPDGNVKPDGMPDHWKHNESVTSTTLTVTALTTFCPGPTEITHNGKTITVTEATLLTITDCPCTITREHRPTREPETRSVTICVTTDKNKPTASPAQPTIGPDNKPTASPEQPTEVKPKPNKPTASPEQPTESQNQGAASSSGHPIPTVEPFTGAATSMIKKVGGVIVGAVAGFVIFAL
ncbi:hypothetical protein B0J14DRAFT_54738 [Halenospora varia]|nr:hypothetical protein B0J14DRAFT_54738 [Halenospora varia]